MKKLRIRLTREEYDFLLEILKDKRAEIKADIRHGAIEPDHAEKKLEMLLHIKHAVSFIDREVLHKK